MRDTVITARAGLMVACLAMGAACKKSQINPNDSTPPTVVIKAKQNNVYAPATSVDLHAGQQVDVMAIVSDPDGVRSLSLQFSGGTASHCTVGSTVYSGSFPISLPSGMQQTLQGDASSQVLTQLPLLATVNDPTCKPLGGQEGRPIGHTITVQAAGTNWSSNPQNSSASATLQIHIK